MCIRDRPIAHKIENTNVTKKPTCSETGEKVGVCSICHQTITQTIPATGHKAGEWEMYTEPTIDSAGEKVQKCTVCGAIVNRWSVHLTPEEIYERYYPITLVSLSKRNISSYNECHYSIPVSYTHLDVYKRQSLFIAIAIHS